MRAVLTLVESNRRTPAADYVSRKLMLDPDVGAAMDSETST